MAEVPKPPCTHARRDFLSVFWACHGEAEICCTVPSREPHLGERGAGLAGGRIRRVLSGPVCHVLLVMRRSGGVSGVDGLTWESDEKWRLGLLPSGQAPAVAV